MGCPLRALLSTRVRYKPVSWSEGATIYRIAEATGKEDEKLPKRVLGHSDRRVTAIYNRFAYVKEVSRIWANAPKNCSLRNP